MWRGSTGKSAKNDIFTWRASMEFNDEPFRGASEYHDLPPVRTIQAAYQSDKSRRVVGPDEELDDPENDFKIDYAENLPWLAATSTSTYPKLPGKAKREGDPIADTFSIQTQENGITVVSVADGCNWGPKPREAAVRANAAFVDYLNTKQEQITDVVEAGHFLLRAFECAHRNIIEGKQSVWEAGTTTLFGGILLRLHPESAAQCFKKKHNKPSWGFVCASVGDCKGFFYSRSKREAVDITAHNRFDINDASDPGGRLGPFLPPDGLPDLRNLKLYFIPCEENDVFAVVSDGVYDNMDPFHLGLEPKDLEEKLDFEQWSDMPKNKEELAKITFAEKFLRTQFIEAKDGTARSPKDVVSRMIQHVLVTTQKGRDWLKANPKRRLPTDYKQFPGKMDHATCVVFQVPDPHDFEPYPESISSSVHKGSGIKSKPSQKRKKGASSSKHDASSSSSSQSSSEASSDSEGESVEIVNQ